MPVAGIIAEYNPFHTGHGWHIAQTRRALGEDAGIVCVMSGNWVQGADCALADKWTRARLALMGGADLVLELPTLWAASSAETFAWGGVSLLEAAGVVDVISFGSECGETAPLEALAACMDSEPYRAALRRELDRGMGYAACRQAAAGEVLGAETAALLRKPNNSLGVEYIRALGRLGSAVKPMTVRREGAHRGGAVALLQAARAGAEAPSSPRFRSATEIRLALMDGDWAGAEPYLLPGEAALLRGVQLPGRAALAGLERAFLARLRTMAASDWAALPDGGEAEGLTERLARAGREARSMEEFYALAKTRRYTHARLRRLALWAFLGLKEADRPARPPYLRVLGCGGRGRALLREMKGRAALPILTKSAHVRGLDETCRRVFALEARCTDLYGLCLAQIPAGGREWTENPVIAE